MGQSTINENFDKWVICKNIFLTKKNGQMTRTMLANSIKIPPTHPYYNDCIIILKEQNIIKVVKTIGNMKFLEIDHSKLKLFLENTDVYTHFQQFIRNKTLFWAGV